MEIKELEVQALNEINVLLQQLEVKGMNNMYIMSGTFSRLQMVLQNIAKYEEDAKNTKAKQEEVT